MNKNLLTILLILVLQVPALAGSYIDKQLNESKKNIKYNSTQKHVKKYNLPEPKSDIAIKDPKLIQINNITPVPANQYEAKLAKDEVIYRTKIIPAIKKDLKTINIHPANIDFYNIYRISERLIRANNLDYTNWRIAIRKSEDNFDAQASSANLISINTALYDTLYNDEDALAFVIAHEMAHHILGHEQRFAELTYRLNRLSKKLVGSDTSLADPAVSIAATVQKKRLLAQSRQMEYMADIEAGILLTRAGYDMNKAMYALNFINALPHVKTLNDSHPQPQRRIESMTQNSFTFASEWIDEGKLNIFNSEVLKCKKSSDRVSIIINKAPNAKKFYKPENYEQKLTRIAYSCYKKGSMTNAIKYFDKLNNISENYISYLYISYANEYLYSETQNKKYLKAAIKSVEKSKELSPDNKYVMEQYNNLINQQSSLQ